VVADPPPGVGSGALGKVTIVLGAAFLAAVSYMTLESAVSSSGIDDKTAMSGMGVSSLRRLSSGEMSEEELLARRAFARDPLDAEAVIDLSHIADVEGRTEASERLKLAAGEMMPRATGVQAEALMILLRRRDFDRVMSRLDGLIRARPSEARNFFGLASEIAVEPDASKAVARMLATNPPWREQFFGALAAGNEPGTASHIIDDLRAMGASVESGEIRSVIDGYIRAGDVDRSYAAWLSSLSEDELRDVKRVYDGGFSHPIRNLRFDWTLVPADGFTYRLFPRNTASMDQTLQLDFVDFGGTFSNLSQILRLEPGRYRLSGEVRFEDFASPAGVAFHIYCRDGGQMRQLEETSSLPQSNQWIGFEKIFNIPKAKCATQLLQMESRASLDKEQLTHGMIALDVLSIDKMPDLVQ